MGFSLERPSNAGPTGIDTCKLVAGEPYGLRSPETTAHTGKHDRNMARASSWHRLSHGPAGDYLLNRISITSPSRTR